MSTPERAGETPEQAPVAPEDRYPDPAIGQAVGTGAVMTPIATAAGTAAALSTVYPAVKALLLAGRTLAAILKLLRRYFKIQRARQRWAMINLWRKRGLPVVSAVPDSPTDSDLSRLLAEEDMRQGEFERKVEERVARDAQKALGLPTDRERREALDKLQAREERYNRQRNVAQAIRMFAAVDREYLRRVSPEGAVWKLDPNKKTHTADCVAAARVGFFTWEALAVLTPPVHAGCGCSLHDPKLLPPTPGAKLTGDQSVALMRKIAAMPHDH